jgi:hypothetical protein
MEAIMNVLEKILDLISKNYASDAAFEVAANLPPKTVYDWKRGKSKGYLKILPKLSELFGVPVAHFYGEAINTDIKNKPVATEDDELNQYMNDPELKRAIDIIRKLNPDFRKSALDQLASIEALQDKLDNK